MIIFLRHAERGDNQFPMKLSEIAYDPPIIDNSLGTIQTSCDELLTIFKQNQIKNVKMMSSKFLRCLMTAKKMQQYLQQNGVKFQDKSIDVDDRICEYMREDWYQQYPLSQLIYHTDHISKYIQNVQIKQRNKTQKKWAFPQNYVKFHNRVASFKSQLKFPEEGDCLMIVTHGFLVRQLCFTMNQLPKYQNQIKYCGYAAYKKGTNGEILIRSKL